MTRRAISSDLASVVRQVPIDTELAKASKWEAQGP